MQIETNCFAKNNVDIVAQQKYKFWLLLKSYYTFKKLFSLKIAILFSKMSNLNFGFQYYLF